MGEDLPGIEQTGLQQLRPGLRRQGGALRQGVGVPLGGKGDGELQCPDAALPVGSIEDADPHGAGDLRPAVPDLPAVEEHRALGLDDPGDVRAVVRHDGLRRLLLGQNQLTAAVISLKAIFLQFQFHGHLPILSRLFNL